MKRYEAATLERWTTDTFAACGMPPDEAALAAATIVRSELRGYKTHGLTRIASYVERLRSGEMNPRPHMHHRATRGAIVLDADGAMGHVAGPRAVSLAVDALAASASVLVAIQDCGHLGALGIHALLAAEAGAFCMIGQRTPPMLAMPGFARAAIRPKPLAFRCPMPRAAPILFGIPCSVPAPGPLLLAAPQSPPTPR